MANITESYINALLADATYALDGSTTNGMSGVRLKEVLNARMTPALAEYISENFTVVTHMETNDTLVGSGFDATVWRDGSGKLYVSMQGTTGYGDFVTDIDLAIDGAAKAQIVDMVNWWLRHITPPEASWAPQFELNGDEEIIPSASVQGTGLLTNVSGLSVSGHSLGGHLATAFTRLFGGTPGYIDHTYTYNSGGFNGSSNSFFGSLEQLLTEIGIVGMGAFPGTSQQSNFFAEYGINVTTNNLFNGQQGQRIALFNEEGFAWENHFMYKLTDALALGHILEGIDGTFDIAKMNALFDVGSNEVDASLEAILDAFGELVIGDLYVATPIGDAGDSPLSRAIFHEHLMLLSSVLFTDPNALELVLKPQYQNLRITDTNSLSGSLSANDASGLAYRYALLNLNPFAITGDASLYTPHNTNGQLDYDSYTEQFWQDRAAMLDSLIVRNVRDISDSVLPPSPTNEYTVYEDLTTGRSFVEASQQDKVITFGTDGDDVVTKGSLDNNLYGMGGNDTLHGNAGRDHIEGNTGDDHLYGGAGTDYLYGGEGSDTYYYNSGDGNDFIDDLDAGDRLVINGHTITSVEQMIDQDENVYEDTYGNTYVLTASGELLITVPNGDDADIITLSNFNKDTNHFGIHFQDADEASEPDVPDPIPGLLNLGSGNVSGDPLQQTWLAREGDAEQRYINQQGVYVVFPLLTALWNYAALEDSDGDTFVDLRNWAWDGTSYRELSLEGTDYGDEFHGGDYGEFIFARDGDDQIHGYGEADFIFGGYGSDAIWGGTGNDRIYGYAGDKYEPDLSLNDSFGNDLEDSGDVLYGQDGDDFISGDGGDDYISGGSGIDRTMGGVGKDTIFGGDGSDMISGDGRYESKTTYTDGLAIGESQPIDGYEYDDMLFGEAGNDIIRGELGDDLVVGGDGNDDLRGDYGSEQATMLIDGVEYSAYLVNLNGNPHQLSGQYHGDDILLGGQGEDTIYGNGGDDIVDGGTEDDRIWGDSISLEGEYHGNDFLSGGGGADFIVGGGGDDHIQGGQGANTIWGDEEVYSNETAILLAGQYHGRDVIFAGDDARNFIYGGGAGDEIHGGAASDLIFGDSVYELLQVNYEFGSYSDVLAGSNKLAEEWHGHDLIFGGAGDDFIYAGAGDDRVHGDAGNDSLSGGNGDDSLMGGAGQDMLLGGLGDDVLTGGSGDDVLIGGEGNDRYVIENDGSVDYIDDAQGQNEIVIGPGVAISAAELRFTDEDSYLILPDDSQVVALRFSRQGFAPSSFSLFESSSGIERSFMDIDQIHDYRSLSSVANSIQSGNGNDVVYTSDLDNTVFLGAGNDRLQASLGNDTIIGGQGDDDLSGGAGSDTYLFQAGDGRDAITDMSDLDPSTPDYNVIRLGTGYSAQSTAFDQDGNDLVIRNGVQDQIRVTNYFLNVAHEIDSIEFEDGSFVSVGSHRDETLTGSLFDDKVVGFAGSDTLVGSLGNDVLMGGAGNDTYVYSLGDGHDTINDLSGPSRLRLGAGIGLSDLVMSDEAEGLCLSIRQGGVVVGSVTFAYPVSGAPISVLESITLHNGSILSGSGLGAIYNGVIAPSPYSTTPILTPIFSSLSYEYALPADTFFNDSPATDVYTATLADGSPLPSWLSFDSSRLSFNIVGTDPGAQAVTVNVSVLTSNGLSAVQSFSLAPSAVVVGTNGADYLDGFSTPTYINGAAGDDLLEGYGAIDLLVGGTGRDRLYASEGNDLLFGGDGMDRLYGDEGDDLLSGGNDDDHLEGGSGNDRMDGGAGYDQLFGGSGDDVLAGGMGSPDGDDLIGGDGNDVFLVEDGFGAVYIEPTEMNAGEVNYVYITALVSPLDALCAKQDNSLVINFPNSGQQIYLWNYFVLDERSGRYSGESIPIVFAGSGYGEVFRFSDAVAAISRGTDDADVINGLLYGENLQGMGGNDTIDGADGNDLISGGLGDDSLAGGYGDDRIMGDEGADNINGGEGADLLYGGAGDDTIFGFRGGDTIWGDDGNDTLYDGDGTVVGGHEFGLSIDTLHGGAGNDVLYDLYSDYNVAYLYGDAGSDYLETSGGDAYLYGGEGNDVLTPTHIGRNLDDVVYLSGEAGNDIYNISLNLSSTNGVFADVTIDDQGSASDMDVLNISTTTSIGIQYYFRQGNDLSLGGMVVKDWFNAAANNIEQIFIDGVLFARTSVQFDASVSLVGGTGNDVLAGGGDFDSIQGGDGADTLSGGAGVDYLLGGNGDDVFLCEQDGAADFIDGQGGVDTLMGTSASDTLYLDDYLTSIERIDGGAGINVLKTNGNGYHDLSGLSLVNIDHIAVDAPVSLVATEGNDAIHISASSAGSYGVDGTAGNDSFLVISDSFTSLRLLGGDGYDAVVFGENVDTVHLYDPYGIELIEGGNGFNTLTISSNSDLSNVTLNDIDLIFGAAGTSILASSGDDVVETAGQAVYGGLGNDILRISPTTVRGSAFTGNQQLLYGEDGNDALYGYNDVDYLYGGLGDDLLEGGGGNDKLYDGAGRDTLIGGAGNDQYHISLGGFTTINNSAADTAVDAGYLYGPNGGAVSSNDLIFSRVGDDMIVTSSFGGAIEIQDWYASEANRLDSLVLGEGLDHSFTLSAADMERRAAGFHVNNAPVSSGFTLELDSRYGSYLSFSSLQATLSDADGDAITITDRFVNFPDELDWSWVGGDRYLIASRDPNHSGQHLLEYVVSDGKDSVVETFTVNVNFVNSAPVVSSATFHPVDDGQVFEIDIAEFIRVHVDDENPTDTLSINSVSVVSGGDVQLNQAAGKIIFTPNASQIDRAQFWVSVTDGVINTLSLVTLDYPFGNPDSSYIHVGDDEYSASGMNVFELSVSSLLANDSDSDGDSLALVSVGQAMGGRVFYDELSETITFSRQDSSITQGTFIYSVTDGANVSSSWATISFGEALNTPPQVNHGFEDVTSAEDSLFNLEVPANAFSDLDGDLLTYSVGTLPSWLSFNGTTFSGTPANANVGSTTITVIASDGLTSVNTDFTLTVTNINDAPVVSLVLADQSVNEREALSFGIPAGSFTDVDVADGLTYSATMEDGSPLPAWLTFNPSTQTFTGTPGAVDIGTLSLSVTATDTAGASVSDVFNVTILNVNDAPVVDHGIANNGVAEDAGFSLVIPANAFSDLDGDALTYSVETLPGWLTFNGTAFSGTPTNSDVGSTTITVTASDGVLTISSDFTVTVINTNDAPVASIALANQSGTEGNLLSFGIPVGSFTDVDAGDSLSYSASRADGSPLPAWLTFDAETRVFSGTPGESDVGMLSLRVMATDFAGLSAFTTFTVTVDGSDSYDFTLVGTGSANTLTGTAGRDFLDGLGGNDTIYGQDGDDTIIGGLGNDTLHGGAGDDEFVIEGSGQGTDQVFGNEGVDSIVGGTGNDTFMFARLDLASSIELINGGAGINVISGTTSGNTLDFSATTLTGIAHINGGAGNDTITGSAGNDRIIGGSGNDTLYGGLGNDEFVVEGSTQGSDTIYGGAGFDSIVGGAGSDTMTLARLNLASGIELIDGGAGINVISGTTSGNTLDFSATTLTGITQIDGGAGNDMITGSAGNDRIIGGAGNDTMYGGDGDDVFVVEGSGQGSDAIHGGAGFDSIIGGTGNDTITLVRFDLASSIERINGGAGINILAGTTANNILDFSATTLMGIAHIDGGSGNDVITGASGDDIILGGAGRDTLHGGVGNDQLTGGLGNDTLNGGDGSDTYLFGAGSGTDVINNYDASSGSTDIARFDGVAVDDLWFSRSDNNLVVTLAGTVDRVTINNWYTSGDYQLDRLEVGSSYLLNSQVDQLVSAMSSFGVPSGAGNVIPQDVKDQLQPVLAASWQAA